MKPPAALSSHQHWPLVHLLVLERTTKHRQHGLTFDSLRPFVFQLRLEDEFKELRLPWLPGLLDMHGG